MNGQQNAIKISHLSKLQKELNSEIDPIAQNHMGLQALVNLIPRITTMSSTFMSYFYSYSEWVYKVISEEGKLSNMGWTGDAFHTWLGQIQIHM